MVPVVPPAATVRSSDALKLGDSPAMVPLYWPSRLVGPVTPESFLHAAPDAITTSAVALRIRLNGRMGMPAFGESEIRNPKKKMRPAVWIPPTQPVSRSARQRASRLMASELRSNMHPDRPRASLVVRRPSHLGIAVVQGPGVKRGGAIAAPFSGPLATGRTSSIPR